uniref:(northern house mosquito) hypothetical protein n=1 Tax=Culex pipiens TaxID=7175 RepID=A0A8D8F718_CULPI
MLVLSVICAIQHFIKLFYFREEVRCVGHTHESVPVYVESAYCTLAVTTGNCSMTACGCQSGSRISASGQARSTSRSVITPTCWVISWRQFAATHFGDRGRYFAYFIIANPAVFTLKSSRKSPTLRFCSGIFVCLGKFRTDCGWCCALVMRK